MNTPPLNRLSRSISPFLVQKPLCRWHVPFFNALRQTWEETPSRDDTSFPHLKTISLTFPRFGELPITRNELPSRASHVIFFFSPPVSTPPSRGVFSFIGSSSASAQCLPPFLPQDFLHASEPTRDPTIPPLYELHLILMVTFFPPRPYR